jgi:hypothetical protein
LEGLNFGVQLLINFLSVDFVGVQFPVLLA